MSLQRSNRTTQTARILLAFSIIASSFFYKWQYESDVYAQSVEELAEQGTALQSGVILLKEGEIDLGVVVSPVDIRKAYVLCESLDGEVVNATCEFLDSNHLHIERTSAENELEIRYEIIESVDVLVQSGVVSLRSVESNSGNVMIPNRVKPENSTVYWSASCSSDLERVIGCHEFSGQIVNNGMSVKFERSVTGAEAIIHWFVVEQVDGASVPSGSDNEVSDGDFGDAGDMSVLPTIELGSDVSDISKESDYLVVQNNYRWFVDNGLVNPTEVWGEPDLPENTSITILPATADPPNAEQELRLRLNLIVYTETESSFQFDGRYKLQYKKGTDGNCTTGDWIDVGEGGAWEFAESDVPDGSVISSELTTTDWPSVYTISNPTQKSIRTLVPGDEVEFDFHVVGAGISDATQYSFRVVQEDGSEITGYVSCPTLTTEPNTGTLLRHGSIFSDEREKGFYWAN